MKINKPILVSLFGLSAALFDTSAHATLTAYTDKDAFLSMLSTYWEDPFDDATSGGIQDASVTRSDGTFSVTYSADGPLYSLTGVMSTNLDNARLFAKPLGTHVYAVGGYFFLTDEFGDPQPFSGNNITVTTRNLVDPATQLTGASSLTNFFGWISTSPIAYVTVGQAGGANAQWYSVDNFIVGDVPHPPSVPEPASLALVAMGAMVSSRRFLNLTAIKFNGISV